MSEAPVTGHVGLNVSDLARSVDFYTHVLGLDVQSRSDADGRAFAFLGSGGGPVLTLWQQSDRPFSSSAAGLHHLSFAARDAAEVEKIAGRLRERGARIFHGQVAAHREGSDSGGVFFADPDGIRLEVFAPDAGAGRSAPSGSAPTCGFF
jgi:catechol 2,3-dioxygenase-like lactoylglutathione lyase family enzyme